ncbi:MAG TPA: cholesterol oxidase substrate-binding domain-containing protein [Actinocrinis sp.]|nr:cholesterol oxidase substrate-binding domain-containing protein [Actinocrinis sp.]
MQESPDTGLPRRRMLAGSAALLGLGAPDLWRPARRIEPEAAAASCAAPPDFPAGVPVYQQTYENWSGGLVADDMWTCTPGSPGDVVTLANWALSHGYRLRARGRMHTWSPLTVTAGESCATPTVLVDTGSLTAMGIPAPGSVRVQTGASMDDLLAYLESAGHGMTATPAPGDLTVGGVLAIDGHGTAIPADGEAPVAGDYYGTLSNRILSLDAVVWDAASNSYALRTFQRGAPGCAALLTHLGRAFLTEVTLSVRANYALRCVSDVTIPASELFAPPATAGARSFASFVESSGRAEAIWFPFTDNPWLKVWSLSPQRPLTSRETTTPYNYPFADTVPKPVADLAGALVSGQWYLAPAFGQAQYAAAAAGLTATLSADLWGLSKNLLLYVKPTTLRMFANGYAVLTSRANIQQVVSDFTARYLRLLQSYAAAGSYPVNGPIEIRVTRLDTAAADGTPPPALSAVRERADHPEWDVAVWLDLLSLPATPDLGAFCRDLEQFLFSHYTGAYAAVRPEWSKGWAFTSAGAWTDATVIGTTIPATFRAGPDPSWDGTLADLDALDPARVFGNAFLDALVP